MFLGLLLITLIMSHSRADGDVYKLGVGIHDITGPAAEINMMGYAKPGQSTAGIHIRLYARSFIIQDSAGNRIVYVVNDLGMMSTAIRLKVLELLKPKYDGMYTEQNVMLAGTHTHSGPGGFLQYVLYIITSQGFVHDNFNTIVNGISESIDKAHNNMVSGRLLYNQGILNGASINRSPSAYLNNTAMERSRYATNTDNEMFMLKLVDLKGKPIGMLNWFAVHPTSMNNTNNLISGDNKGLAAQLFEAEMNPGQLAGKGPFVAGFANANLGDISPNIKGPRCLDSGKFCDFNSSTCEGKNEECVAVGPGQDMFDSTHIIASKQFDKAWELFKSSKSEYISGPIKHIHQYIKMSDLEIVLKDGSKVSTCKPAMGYSFAAGTVDGPGAFNFKQGTTSTNPFWNLVTDFLSKPSPQMIKCHHPKPILLATGQMNFPYSWQPQIVPTQLFQIGSKTFLAAVPAEFTSMSGRRLKDRVKAMAKSKGLITTNVILSGLTNSYSSYVATFEEYQIQRYEGASTIFGPYTLDAYLNQFDRLSKALLTNSKLESGPTPPNLLAKQISLKPGVIFDTVPPFSKFGEVLQQPKEEYTDGETVTVRFRSGHPRNNLMNNPTFLTVELKLNDTWVVVAEDAAFETKFRWKRTNSILGWSEATVSWDIPNTADEGTYRIRHFGHYKSIFHIIKSYIGTSSEFTVRRKKGVYYYLM